MAQVKFRAEALQAFAERESRHVEARIHSPLFFLGHWIVAASVVVLACSVLAVVQGPVCVRGKSLPGPKGSGFVAFVGALPEEAATGATVELLDGSAAGVSGRLVKVVGRREAGLLPPEFSWVRPLLEERAGLARALEGRADAWFALIRLNGAEDTDHSLKVTRRCWLRIRGASSPLVWTILRGCV
jgi:hypothetical protein